MCKGGTRADPKEFKGQGASGGRRILLGGRYLGSYLGEDYLTSGKGNQRRVNHKRTSGDGGVSFFFFLFFRTKGGGIWLEQRVKGVVLVESRAVNEGIFGST